MILAISAALNLTSGDSWIQRESPEAVEWTKEQLKIDLELEQLKEQNKNITFGITPDLNAKKCITNFTSIASDAEIPLYVLISFSVPEETWVSLSSEMEEIGAVFVLRGLPNNSFKRLSQKIQHLNSLGVKAPIQIDPQLFTNYEISRVPSFLIIKNQAYSKVSGNISLRYALEKMGGIKK
jgi:conjugal transfer pilus assembly protein TrbC